MGFFKKLLICFVGIILFMCIIAECEKNNYYENKRKNARLNYEMYFNSISNMCLENSDFKSTLSNKLIEGHSHNCPACNFVIVNEYLNNKDWDDTVGEFPEADGIETMIQGYLELMGNEIECNHNNTSSHNESHYNPSEQLPLHVASGVI